MNKIASIIIACLYVAVLAMTASPALCAEADTAAVKSNRTYEVNEEYIERKAAEKAAQPSRLVVFVKQNLASDSLSHKFYFLLYMLLPFAILAISLWMDFSGGWGDRRKLFMLGLAEFVFGAGNAGMGADVYPWFCDFDIVGWIVTILCFCYMLRLLLKQAGLFIGYVNGASDGVFVRKLILYVIYVGIAVSVTMLLSAKAYFWTAPIVVAAAWYYFYRDAYGDAAAATRTLVNTGVMFGGFIIFFLQVVGLIMIVALALFLLTGFASIRISPTAMDGGGMSSDDGILERSADGTPFVRHRDGSATQLRDRGDGLFEGPDGSPWRDNGSGHLFR